MGGPRRPWDRLGSVFLFVLRSGLAFLSLLDASWARFGVLLGSFLVILGALGLVLGHLGLLLGHSG